MNKASKKKKFFLIFMFIILGSFLLIGFLVIRDAVYEEQLKKEIAILSKLDITKDRYNTKIKTGGSYAVVEKSIKEYLDNYAVNLQKVLNIINDEQFTSLLQVDNFKKDGPDFKKSFSYIKDTRKDFNTKIFKLIENCDAKKIKDGIKDKMLDPYYISLYQELMFDDDMSKDILESKELLEETKEKVNLVFDISEKVFTLLKENSADWKIEDGQIKFKTVELLNQYNSYVMQIS